MKKERGQFLTILLALVSLGTAYNLYSLVTSDVFSLLSNNPFNGPVYFDIATIVAPVIPLVGIWLWKKWAVYLLFILAALNIALTGMNLLNPGNNSEQSSMLATFGGTGVMILILILWFLAIRQKWQYFE